MAQGLFGLGDPGAAMAMMNGGGGAPGPGGGQMPGPMPGMQTPGPADPSQQAALTALDQLGAKPPNALATIQKVQQAYDLAHKLIMASLPQLVAWSPKAAKDAHAAARMILNIKDDLMEEATAMQPPPDLMGGFGMAGAPPAGTPGGMGY